MKKATDEERLKKSGGANFSRFWNVVRTLVFFSKAAGKYKKYSKWINVVSVLKTTPVCTLGKILKSDKNEMQKGSETQEMVAWVSRVIMSCPKGGKKGK